MLDCFGFSWALRGSDPSLHNTAPGDGQKRAALGSWPPSLRLIPGCGDARWSVRLKPSVSSAASVTLWHISVRQQDLRRHARRHGVPRGIVRSGFITRAQVPSVTVIHPVGAIALALDGADQAI